MRQFIKPAGSLAGALLLLSACASDSGRETIGLVGGGAGGAAIGSALGGSTAVALGAIGGAFLGHELAEDYNDDLDDRRVVHYDSDSDYDYARYDEAVVYGHEGEVLQDATVIALETGRDQQFDAGDFEGFVRVSDDFRDDFGRICRRFEQDVEVDGRDFEDEGVACRTDDGWREV